MSWPRWPPALEPARCPVFVRNERPIAAPPEAVWQWLCRADLWPTWFSQCRDVRFPDGGGPGLRAGTRVRWRMLGATIDVTVKVCEPPRALDWEGGAAGVHAYHAWLIEPAAGGARLVTAETERGPLPWLLRWYLRGALHRAHEAWVGDLARVAAGGAPPAAGA
ncbi:MAG TPA: SRPBCC domain-containing protein [Candidatus Binatia bacterium]|nr:SRPBCC domain-containing protein [Candidatus Binatia bacterium]